MVRGARPSRDLRGRKERRDGGQEPLARSECRSGRQRRADRPRRPRHREERARGEAAGAEEGPHDARGGPPPRGDGAPLSPAGAQGAADASNPGAERTEEEGAGSAGGAQTDGVIGDALGIFASGSGPTVWTVGPLSFVLWTRFFGIPLTIP